MSDWALAIAGLVFCWCADSLNRTIGKSAELIAAALRDQAEAIRQGNHRLDTIKYRLAEISDTAKRIAPPSGMEDQDWLDRLTKAVGTDD